MGRFGTADSPLSRRWSQIEILLTFVAVMWILEGIDLILPGRLDQWGIRPRSLSGLIGIFLAPFLHGGFDHLLANTVPVLVLGWLVMLRGTRDFLLVTLGVTLISGLGVWIVGGRQTVHIGASGVIFGYFGFLVLRAWYERSIASFAIALLVVIFYGGLIAGVLPSDPDVSWEAHLFGVAGGAVMARSLPHGNARRRSLD